MSVYEELRGIFFLLYFFVAMLILTFAEQIQFVLHRVRKMGMSMKQRATRRENRRKKTDKLRETAKAHDERVARDKAAARNEDGVDDDAD